MNELLDTAELEAVLQELGEDVRKGYIETLLRNDHRATGELINSVTAVVDVQGEVYEVKLQLADYWKYVEDDTQAHWPPRGAILKWIKAKPVIPRPDERGRIPKPEQLAFLIRRAIAGKSPNQAYLKNPQGGTIGTHDLQKTLDAIMPVWGEKLRLALARMWTKYIREIFYRG